MPAGWVAAGAAVLGAGVSYLGSKKTSEAAEKAGEREGAASERAIERQEAAYAEAQQALSPYARQEAAASSQMMAQMGIAPIAGGAEDPWGFAPGGYEAGQMGGGEVGSMDRFLQDLLANETAISLRAGYKGKHGIRAVHEGARRAEQFLKQLQQQGKIPADYQIPQLQDLVGIGETAMQAHGGYKSLLRSNVAGGKKHEEYGIADVQNLASQYFDPDTGMDLSAPGEGEVQAGGPGGMMGGGQMIDPVTGEVTTMPGGAGPQVQTIQSIMERAGAEGLPEGFREQYFEGLMADPRTDPELAGYLGLTPESMQVGAEYQETPAYMAAREAGIEAVDASAAAGGGLYSGRRGKALRDVGQEVEQQYYFDAMQRREAMMGARRGERTAGLGRMGATYQAGQQREQSYYNNYMQMLNELSAPQTTTNIAAMGTSLGKETSANIMGTARNLSELEIGAAGAEQAMYADVGGGLMNLGAAYLGPRGK